MKHARPSTGLLGVAAAVVALFILVEWRMTTPIVLPALPDGAMNDSQQKLVDVLNQYANVFSTLGVGIIGAVAFISKEFLEAHGFRLWYWVCAAACSFFALASVFISQLTINMLLRSLLLKQDIAGDDRFFLLLNAQYYCLSLALLLFIVMGSLSMLRPRNGPG